ncbi:MAG: hypothetical protein J6113_06185 [Lachnospiraceae bacterium]|nr:hypothetical protein [Lachnospiraceae bacterium]
MGLFSKKKKNDIVTAPENVSVPVPDTFEIPQENAVKSSIPEIREAADAAEGTINADAAGFDAAKGAGAPTLSPEQEEANKLREDEAMLNFAINQQQELDKEAGASVKVKERKVFKGDDSMRAMEEKALKKEAGRAGAIIKVILALILAAVLFVVGYNLGRRNVTPGTNPGTPTPVPTGNEEPVVKNRFIINDLNDYVLGLSDGQTAPFAASVETVYGYEHLVFTSGKLKILYRNEYPADEKEVKRVTIDNGRYRCEMDFDFDLTADVKSLLPILGDFGGDGSSELIFIGYSNGFPEKIEIVDANKLFNYGTVDIAGGIESNYKVVFTEDPSLEDEGKRYLMEFTYANTKYVYSVSKDTFVAGEYDSMDVIDYKDGFELKLDGDTISFESTIKTTAEEYLGKLTGSVTKNGLEFKVSGTRFGSFTIPSQAGFGKDNIITPQVAPFTSYVTIIAKGGQRFLLPIYDEITPISIDWANMRVNEDGTFEYVVDGKVQSIMGIDVSHYQGDIDWEKVAAAGVKFVIIRLGYRGYGEGTLEMDRCFKQNIEGALAAGIKVGIYFFSEAINTDEAVEEAEFVLSKIKDYDVQYPIVFDTEDIANVDARANNIVFEERTAIARAFCDTIKEAGYRPMIYANSRFMLTAVDLSQLNDIDRWFAYYGTTSQFPYSFNIFQYSESGKIDGIPNAVDLDISFVDYSKE